MCSQSTLVQVNNKSAIKPHLVSNIVTSSSLAPSSSICTPSMGNSPLNQNKKIGHEKKIKRPHKKMLAKHAIPIMVRLLCNT